MCIKSIANVTRKELEPFVLERFSSDWGGSCLISSWMLNRILKYKKYKSKLALGWYNFSSHAFVLVDDKTILDITATQFNLDETHIEELNNDSKYYIDYLGPEVYWAMETWPSNQIYWGYPRKLRNIYETILCQI